jgi:hypothetical protein
VSVQRGDPQFLHADAETYRFEEARFDVVLSRFGVMFFTNPADAFANLARALRPGGRLVFVCWGQPQANAWIQTLSAVLASHLTLPDLGSEGGPGPFSMAEPEHVRSLLVDRAGFNEVSIDELSVPVCLGTSVAGAVDYLQSLGPVQQMLTGTQSDTVERIMIEVADALRPFERDDGVWLGSSIWLVSATRPTGT